MAKKTNASTKGKVGNRRKSIHIFVDTNSLFTPSNQYLANRDFEGLITDYKKQVKLHLYIPELVIEELTRQKRNSIWGFREKLNGMLSQFNNSLEQSYKSEISSVSIKQVEERVRERYHDYFQCWGIDAQILKTDTSSLSLDEALENAMKRVVPFSEDSDKGLTDYVIFKNLTSFISKQSFRGQKYIVCNDDRLSKAFESFFNKYDGLFLVKDFKVLKRELDKIVADVEQSWIDKVNALARSEAEKHIENIKENITNEGTQAIFDISFLNSDPNFSTLVALPPPLSIVDTKIEIVRTDFHAMVSNSGRSKICTFISDVNITQFVRGIPTLDQFTSLYSSGYLLRPERAQQPRSVDIMYKFKVTWNGTLNGSATSLKLDRITSTEWQSREFLNANFFIREAFDLDLPISI